MKKRFFVIKTNAITLIAPQRILLRKLKNALALVQSIDIKEYRKLFSRLSAVFVTNRSGYTNEFFMPEKTWFTNKSVIEKNNAIWVASLLIHEAFHATQFHKGKYTVPLSGLESPALNVQQRFLDKAYKKKVTKLPIYVPRDRYWLKTSKDKKSSFAYFRRLLRLLGTNKLTFRKI